MLGIKKNTEKVKYSGAKAEPGTLENEGIVPEERKVRRTRRRIVSGSDQEQGGAEDAPSFQFTGERDFSQFSCIGAKRFQIGNLQDNEEVDEEVDEESFDNSLEDFSEISDKAENDTSSDTEQGMIELVAEPSDGILTDAGLEEPTPSDPVTANVEQNDPDFIENKQTPEYHDVLRGVHIREKEDVATKLRTAIAKYHASNSGVFSNEVTINYVDDSQQQCAVTDDGCILLTHRRVFYQGFPLVWGAENETRFGKGKDIELDLGLSFTLPDGYELEIVGCSELSRKFGLELVGGLVHLNRQTALFPIVLHLRTLDDLAYVPRFQSVLQARVVRV